MFTVTWRWHIRVMKLCAMLNDARNCMVTLTDWPMDRVGSCPSSGSQHSHSQRMECAILQCQTGEPNVAYMLHATRHSNLRS